MWTTEKTLSLIRTLYSTPSLWDVTCPQYKDRTKKKDDLQTLADEYRVTDLEMEKKIHSLKSQFRREHNKLMSSQKSGCSPKACLWFGYAPLLFLLNDQTKGSRNTDSYDELEVS